MASLKVKDRNPDEPKNTEPWNSKVKASAQEAKRLWYFLHTQYVSHCVSNVKSQKTSIGATE